ncbi:MAG: FAD/NAD(P)-binding protein [Microthrixaceae bacterium]
MRDHAPDTGQGPMVPVAYRVERRREELPDTVTLWLRPTAQALPTPTPGQFNMLWAFGVGEVPISLAGVDGDVLAHTVRRVGQVTEALCALAEGDEVGVRGPYGAGWDLPRAAGRDVLVVAGGLGLVPLRPLIHDVLAGRHRFGSVALCIGARSPSELLYTEEVSRWADEMDVTIAVDTAPPSWKGRVGVVTKLIASAGIDPTLTTAFVCGPEVMMRFAARAALDRGVPPSEVFVSLERNMACAIGHCGHCQLGPHFVCKDGPVLAWDRVAPQLAVRAR